MLQVGERFANHGPDTLTSCGDPSNVLNDSTTYLVGIGGGYSKIREYSLYKSVPSEIMNVITDGCSSCSVRFSMLMRMAVQQYQH